MLTSIVYRLRCIANNIFFQPTDITASDLFELYLEQAYIDRRAQEFEIYELRKLLNEKGIAGTEIQSWIDCSDHIINKLLRYNLGSYGKVSASKRFFLPHSFKRRCRRILSRSAASLSSNHLH